LLVVPFTRPDYSGSGINALNFAGFLKGKGYPAAVLTFNRNLTLKSNEIIQGVPIRRIAYFNRNLFFKAVSMLLIIPSYIRFVAWSDVIIIYGAHLIGYQFLIVLGRLMGKCIVFRSLLFGADDLETLMKSRSPLARKFLVGLYRKVDLYFAINPVFAGSWKKFLPEEEKILISPQGVDVTVFKPSEEEERINARAELGIAPSDFVLLSVGFLINRKGFSGIFQVLEKVNFEFTYLLAGEFEFGPDHFMKKYAERANAIKREGLNRLGSSLRLMGPVEQIQDMYRVADLILINSSSEGMPNTLLEAMASGKVVLARNLPGIRYMVEHMKNGVLFDNEQEMHEYLGMLHKETMLRRKIGVSAAEHIRSFASFEQVLYRLSEKGIPR
jgi:glycosyltransferase involved in cell wall biosynthesis